MLPIHDRGNDDELGSDRRQVGPGQGQGQGKWGQLTDDDLTQIQGKRDQLAGRIQERYGYTKERVEEEMKAWERDSRW